MRNLLKILLILCYSALTSSCGLLGHRDFYDEMEFSAFEEPMFMPGREFDVVSGDDGRAYRSQEDIYRRTPATAKDRELYSYHNSIRYELYALENRLNDAEYQDYVRIREDLATDSERIYFLRLTDSKQRQQYLQAKGIAINETTWPKRSVKTEVVNTMGARPSNWRRPSFTGIGTGTGIGIDELPSNSKAIELGMRPDDVTSAWGRPMRRDIDGVDEHGNERWTYQMGNRVKYIYFEGGRVQGWSEQ